MSLDTMHDLMIAELRDLYSAETQIVKALPKMAEAPKRRACARRSRTTSARRRNTSPDSRQSLAC